MTSKDIKIPFSYCRIERAANLLECEVDDLLNLGVTKKISLCLNLFDARSVLYVRGDTDTATKWFNGLGKKSTTSLMGNSVTEFSRMHLYSYDYDEETDESVCIPNFGDASQNGCFSSIGKAYGLWRIWSGLEELQNFGEYIVGGCELSPCHPTEGTLATQLLLIADDYDEISDDDQEEVNDEVQFKKKITTCDLWITSYDIRRLLNCNHDYSALSSEDDGIVNIKGVNNIENIHHSAERHARNREQVLMVAMRFKEEQKNVFNESCRKSDGTINYSAWARELIARPDWFAGGELPIKTETKIAGILTNAHRRPCERIK